MKKIKNTHNKPTDIYQGILPLRFLQLLQVPPLLLVILLFLSPVLFPLVFSEEIPSPLVYEYWADENYPPFEFKDSSGNAAGFSVDIIRAIGDELGFRVNVSPHPWAEVKPALANNTIDMSGTMAYDVNRTDRFVFSVPIVTLNWYLYVTHNSTVTSLEQLRGKRIILAKGDIWEEKLQSENFPADITIAADYREQLLQMSTGGYDAAIINKPVALYLMHQEGISNLKPVGEPVERLKLCIATHVSNTDLIEKINEGIVIINRNGMYAEISDRWFSPQERQFEEELFQKILFYVLIPISSLIILILLWIWSLRRMVVSKTADLQSELSARIAAEKAQRKMRYSIEHLNEGIIWFDEQGILFDVNIAFAKLIQTVPQHLTGKPVTEIPFKLDTDSWNNLMNQAKITGFSQFDATMHTAGTETFFRINLSYSEFGDEKVYCGIVTDRTVEERSVRDVLYQKELIVSANEELQSSEEELRENFNHLSQAQWDLKLSEKKYRTLFDDAILGIFQTDMEGNLLEINAAYAHIYGFDTPDEMKAAFKEISANIYTTLNERTDISRELRLKGEIRGFESEQKRWDGSVIWTSINMNVIRDDYGNALYCEGTIEDITRRKRAEYEKDIALRQIQRNFAELSILNDGIRNPLTVIAILAESLSKSSNNMVNEQISQIDALINQLDKRWVESEKIIKYLKKHHNITIEEEKPDT
jgi:PAS domain S-box-containing protein